MYELDKKQLVEILVGCGLKKNQATRLTKDYYLDLMPIFLNAAIKAGKIQPFKPRRNRLDRPSDSVVCLMEPIALRHVKMQDGKLKVVEMEKFLPELQTAEILDPGHLGVVERYELVYQVVSRVPPKIWEREFKMTPQQLVAQRELLDQNDKRTLFGAWYDSAARFADLDWIEAICLADLPFEGASLGIPLSAAPDELQEEILLKMIAKNGGSLRVNDPRYGAQPFHSLLRRSRNWSESFAREMIPLLRAEAENPIRETPDLLREAAAAWPVNLQREFQALPGSETYDDLLKFKWEISSVL